ncbi:60S acidic ribosomal protein P2 isoform X2 [Panthera uncia]|uniref:60S acidic ribosomal protein P2 isoform X2 n=1 Tax=Panthera uncia TaxID=29064 RepID=UPI0020FFD3A5|nr:60S acidic ribosomal protein P2 isoform X2 [Panthera uncia]
MCSRGVGSTDWVWERPQVPAPLGRTDGFLVDEAADGGIVWKWCCWDGGSIPVCVPHGAQPARQTAGDEDLDPGIGKLASVPAGGAVAVSAAPGSAAPAAGSTPAAEEKKDEKKEESEESDDDMGFGLFD